MKEKVEQYAKEMEESLHTLKEHIKNRVAY
jgi:hypothetical protein